MMCLLILFTYLHLFYSGCRFVLAKNSGCCFELKRINQIKSLARFIYLFSFVLFFYFILLIFLSCNISKFDAQLGPKRQKQKGEISKMLFFTIKCGLKLVVGSQFCILLILRFFVFRRQLSVEEGESYFVHFS